MDLSNTKNNQRRKKDKSQNGGFNEFSAITTLVKAYKESQSDKDLLEIVKALEGIINTYTIMLTPGTINQQIFITPYMKKLLGRFLSPEERINSDNDSYNVALIRIRWIMRQYSYEDIYSQVLIRLISVIKKLKIVGDCDCFYYIQWIMVFKIYKLIMDQTKDATVNLADISSHNTGEFENETTESALDRLSFDSENMLYEDKLLDSYYEIDGISIITRTDDIYKCFTYYEKYIIYLNDYLELSKKHMLSLLKYETEEELDERLDDIKEKLLLIKEEENY